LKKEEPKTITLTDGNAIKLFDKLNNTALEADDKGLFRGAVNMHLYLADILSDRKTRLKDIRDLFGVSLLETKSNANTGEDNDSTGDTPEESNSEDDGKNTEEPEADPKSNDSKKPKTKTGGRIPHTSYTGLNNVTFDYTHQFGTICPLCEDGKLYKYDDKVIIRLGNTNQYGSKVTIKQLRCNLCQEIFAKDYSEKYGDDKYSTSFKTRVVMNKYWLGVPFKRMEALYEMDGCPIPDATQWKLVDELSKVVEPVYKEIIRAASNADVIGLDDTSATILSRVEDLKTSDSNRTGTFTSGFVCKDLKKGIEMVLYFNGEKHAGENFADLLALRQVPEEDLVVMCDGLDNILPKALKAIICNCLAHGVRKFKDLLDAFRCECAHILINLKEIYELDAKTKGMNEEDRLNFHKTHSKPILDDLLQWMKDQMDLKLVEGNSSLGKAIRYMIKRWAKLTRFCTTKNAPLDNNFVERILKIAIRTRKNAMFYKTSNGAYVGGMMMTIIETCRVNNINPTKYLNHLQSKPLEVGRNPGDHLPWLYTEGKVAAKAS
jgi:transposase